jgi:cation diffusion facilitator CzcD-associated flavoprotein CzcO
VREDPIERITPTGLKTTNAAYDLDVLVYATGFDAFTGEVTRMDIRGVGGQTIQQRWANGPSMYMGLQTAGFPNLFFENGALFCNFTRCAEATAEFVSGCIGYMRDNGFERIEASQEAEEEWIRQAQALSAGRLISDVSNWADGTNIPGKPVAFVFYAGGFNAYRELCDAVAAKGYEGFELE